MLFVTGFPGFIGKRLVRELLADDPSSKVVCLVEPRMEDVAKNAAAEFEAKERIKILPGDITDRRLGLAPDDYERLTAETTNVFHLAALYNLAAPVELGQPVHGRGPRH